MDVPHVYDQIDHLVVFDNDDSDEGYPETLRSYTDSSGTDSESNAESTMESEPESDGESEAASNVESDMETTSSSESSELSNSSDFSDAEDFTDDEIEEAEQARIADMEQRLQNNIDVVYDWIRSSRLREKRFSHRYVNRLIREDMLEAHRFKKLKALIQEYNDYCADIDTLSEYEDPQNRSLDSRPLSPCCKRNCKLLVY